LLASGAAAEYRILQALESAIHQRQDIADAVDALCEGGEAWTDLRPQTRADLGELGIVGPVWDPPYPTRSDQRPKNLMRIRNPMVEAFAKSRVARRRSEATVALPAASMPEATPRPVRLPRAPSGSAARAGAGELQIGPIARLQVGDVCYNFRTPLTGVYSEDRQEFSVPTLASIGPGRGDALEAAFHDWGLELHLRMQRLVGKEGASMGASDRKAWDELRAVIDVDSLEEARTLDVRQIGEITRIDRSGLVVGWEDGTKETIGLDRLPAACLRYAGGQRVEAMVRRSAASFKAIQVLYVQALPELPEMTEDEMDELWESLPGASSRAEASWD
jgi:hypothetical protein